MAKILFYIFSIIVFIPNISIAASPEIVWLNQSSGISPKDLAVDPFGNTVLVGSFKKSASFGAKKLTAENYGWFIAKYSEQNDKLLWCKQIDYQAKYRSSSYEEGFYSIITDLDGNILIIGNHQGSFNYLKTTYEPVGYIDGIMVKFDPNGNILWFKQFSSPNEVQFSDGKGICTDSQKNIIVSGKFLKYMQVDNKSLYGFGQLSGEAANFDLFTAKFSPNGKLLWLRKDGGVMPDWIYNITTDNDDNIISTGSFCGPATFGDTFLNTEYYAYKYFISKYTKDGDPLWAKQWSGPGCSSGSAVAVDKQNNIIAAGYGMTGAVIEGEMLYANGHYDPVIIKYTPEGNTLWVKIIESGPDSKTYNCGYVRKVIVDNNSNYILSSDLSGDFYFDNEEIDNIDNNLIINLNTDGNLNWYKSPRTNNTGLREPFEINGLDVDHNNNIHMTGSFGRYGDKIEFDEITLTSYGSIDMIIGRLGQSDYSKPDPEFSTSQTEGEVPLQVRFFDQSYGVVHDRKWDLDNDGTVDCTARDCTFTYTEPGAYSVKLTVANDKGVSEKILPYYIIAGQVYPPNADFEADITYGPAPLTVTFNDLSAYIPSQFEWDFNNDGHIDCTEKNCSYTYQYPGRYTVRYVAKNDRGNDQEIKEDYIWVGNPNAYLSKADIYVELKQGESSNASISLLNSGNSTLNFTVELRNTTAPMSLNSSVNKRSKKRSLSRNTGITFKANSNYRKDQLIVKLSPTLTDNDLQKILQEIQIENRKSIDKNVEVWNIHHEAMETILNKYISDPRIIFIEPVYIKTINELPNDPDYTKMWGFHSKGQELKYYSSTIQTIPDVDIDIPEAWDYMKDKIADEIVIAVIDTGIDYNHEELKHALWVNPGETGIDEHGNDKSTNLIDDDSNGYVDDVHGWNFSASGNGNDPIDKIGHGTRLSGIISAQKNNNIGICGISENVKIMALKVFDDNGGGMDFSVFEALKYIVMMREDHGINVKIANMSYGGYDFAQLENQGMEQLKNAGILVIAAAGNETNNTDLFPHYPSCYDYDNIISVSGTNYDNNIFAGTNYGEQTTDIGAPGKYIFTTNMNNKYDYYAGTSYSAPYVSGVAALLWSLHPDWNYQQIKQQLLKSVDPLYSLNQMTTSGGKINANNAVQGLTSWLSSKIYQASIAPDDRISLDFRVHAKHLEEGEYHGTIVFHTNIDQINEISIPVSISVKKNNSTIIDLNGDSKADLLDIIIALQLLSGVENQRTIDIIIDLETIIRLYHEIGGNQ